MPSRPRHDLSAALFALLLLVPLIHGAGAHLGDFATAVHAAEDLARATACHTSDTAPEISLPGTDPASHFGHHASGGFCTLCVTARSVFVRSTGDVVSLPAIPDAERVRPHDDAPRTDRPYRRPEAPRAPPQRLA